jgi:hypothetical protein
VRVVNLSSDTSRDFSLDWAAVRVYYSPASSSALNTLYPSSIYEMESITPTRYYLFNGQAIALRTGSDPLCAINLRAAPPAFLVEPPQHFAAEFAPTITVKIVPPGGTWELPG